LFNFDYCKSLYSNLQNSLIKHIQLIQNSVAYAVVKAPKFSHTTSIIETLHRPKVSECINSRFLSLTYRVYKVLTTTQPSYLYKVISVQSPHNTRSSFCCHHFLDHHRLPVKITNRSIRSASLHLWNQLPASFRQSYTSQSPSHSPHFTHGSSCQSPSLLLPQLIFSLHAQNLHFHKTFPP